MERKGVSSTCWSLLQFHKPELTWENGLLAQWTQCVQALKARAGWLKSSWLSTTTGKNKSKREVIVIFRRSECQTNFPPHADGEGATEAGAFRLWKSQQRGRFQWAARASHCVAGRALTCSVSGLCVVERQTLTGWSNLTVRSLRAPLPGITSAYTSGCQCSEGSPTQL